MISTRSRDLSPLNSRVLEGTLARFKRLRGEIEELERSHGERDELAGVRVLLDALRALTYQFERNLVEMARALCDEGESEGRSASFRQRAGGMLLALEEFLPRQMTVARQSFGREIEPLVTPFSEMARFIASGRELIFLPEGDYEFDDTLKGALVRFTDSYSVRLSMRFRELPDLTVITYPRALDGDLLVHAVIAHELAHLALKRPRPGGGADEPVGRTLIGAQIDSHYEELIGEISRQAGSLDDVKKLDEQERSTLNRIGSWFDELACDYLAVRMVGPVYLFALFDLELPGNRWAQRNYMPGYETHPGLAWRIRNMIPAAHAFLDDPDRQTEAFEAGRRALDAIEDAIPDEEDEISAIERKIIEDALRELAEPDYTEAALPPNVDYLLKRTFASEVDLVWEKLKMGIPPSERIHDRSTAGSEQVDPSEPPENWSLPMDWRAILNGAYIYWLDGQTRTEEPEEWHRSMPLSPHAVSDWHAFNSHIRGTVELAVIHGQADELREKLRRANPPAGI